MSLLQYLRDKKEVVERLKAKGLLNPDEVEILEELGILRNKKEMV